MDAAVIRLQLPAGTAFIAAFDDAADKYAGRRGFADGGALFTRLTSAAVRAVAGSSPATIELEARERTGQIVAIVRGQGASTAIPTTDLAPFAEASVHLITAPTIDADAAVIEFSLPLG